MDEAILIYNHQAGSGFSLKIQEIIQLLKKADIDAVYQVTDSESDLDVILRSPPEMVIAAGGDGTIRGVVKRIIGTETTLGVIPLGTANNFSRSMGIIGDPKKVINDMKNYKKRKIDVGKVFAPWGENIFLEGVGFGLFADLLKRYRPVTEKKIGRALNVFFEGVTNLRTYKSEITVDGENIAGDYLLVEILNSESIGPRLAFAKDSAMHDGYLNVIRITKSENVASVAINLFTNQIDALEGVRRSKAKEVVFTWNGFPVHIDDEVYPDVNEKINYWYATNVSEKSEDKKKEGRKITVRMMEKKLNMLLPS